MAVNLKISLEITKALLEFNDITLRFRDFQPVLRGRMDRAVHDYLRRRFNTQGEGQWEQLSSSYASFKRRKGWRRRILQLSGDMMEAFTALKGHPHQVVVTDFNLYSLTVDEEIAPRARGHQRGFSPAQPRLPRRPIIPDEFPEDFLEKLRQIVRDYAIRGDR